MSRPIGARNRFSAGRGADRVAATLREETGQMKHAHGREDGKQPSPGDPGTFTGQAMLDVALADGAGDTSVVRVNNVSFEPGGRTYWHSHANGQVLLVGSGRGMVETRDGDRHALHPGDVVWAPPGEVHWHGAAPDSPVTHTAVSLGVTEWQEEVSGDRYEAAFREQ
jgi:quercetin dioxygenase-like cupin family protein